MATQLQEQALLLLRQALDNPSADFRTGQWEAIEELLQKRSRFFVKIAIGMVIVSILV